MDKFTPLIRLLIQAGAGALATRGLIKEVDTAAFIDAAMAAVVMALSGLWSYVEKNRIKMSAMSAANGIDASAMASLSAELERLRKENAELKAK